MSRLIRFLARLYPRSWRERYGAEYSALLEEVRPDGRTAADVFIGALAMQIRNWKSWGILAASALFGAGVIGSLFVAVPNSYSSIAVLKVGGQAGTLLSDDALDEINALTVDLESRSRLTQVITAYDLYRGERSRMPLEDVLEEMKSHIRIEPIGSNGAAVAIGFSYSDPRIAQQVTEGIASRFLTASRDSRSVSLEILDPASLPQSSIRNYPVIIVSGIACFLLMWGALSLIRRISIRSHARAGSAEVPPLTWADPRILMASALTGVLVIVACFLTIPKTYISIAVMRVRGQADPQQMSAAINAIARNVEDREKLAEIITTYGLYERQRARMPSEDVAQQMLRSIRVEPLGPKIPAIRVGFEYSDPAIAQRVTQDLAWRFSAEGQNSQGVDLQVLDTASFPESWIRPNNELIVALGLACFLLMWSALSAWRSIYIRRYV